MMILCITITGLAFWGTYALGSATDVETDPYLAAQQHIYQTSIKYSIAGIVVGAILLLAGGFAAEPNGAQKTQ